MNMRKIGRTSVEIGSLSYFQFVFRFVPKNVFVTRKPFFVSIVNRERDKYMKTGSFSSRSFYLVFYVTKSHRVTLVDFFTHWHIRYRHIPISWQVIGAFKIARLICFHKMLSFYLQHDIG